MKRLKTILKYLLFAIIGLVLALAVMPFVFKDKIVQFIKEDINQSIKATMTFSDIDLSIFKSFPSLRISIDSLSLIGQDEFQDITLYKAAKTSVDVNLSSLFGDQIVPEINAILLDKPEINIIILDSLTANYNISRDTVQDDTVQKYHFSLKKYAIKDGKITYQDNTMPMFVVLDHFDHKGSGDFTQDIFDLKTTSKIGKLFVKYDGTTYMNHFS
ncbi:MAG: AsmA family protein, partial [Chitinophagales bacterium]|nr:AsmA family protein [Chitinophagales bacterium]